MAPRRTGTQTRPPLPVKPHDKWPHNGPVTVETADPYAIYWDDEQRTGTIENVPLVIAQEWMAKGWVSYYWLVES